MLPFDNLEGYRDAEAYDALNDLDETMEGKFFLDLGNLYGGPVLDVACGTGRLTIPLAQHGHDTTGIDITYEMLEAAKRKAAELNVSINWVHADARQFELGRTYRFIFTTGNSFQHFLDRESVDGLLRSIHRHLDQNGVFAFETRNPILSRLAVDDESERDSGSWEDKEGFQCSSTYLRKYDHRNQLEFYKFTNRRWKAGTDVTVTEENFALRYFYPQELESLLYYNGFTLEEMYGNFDKSVFQADSPLMVCVCRKR
ncbi:class I SAM-dependent methyltransferase [Paenibacillus lactis]|uniref:class I SAM-dependent methyltransferase n=1 Tax=Paenibacillus lactis TaxID=228574 RepID=UPI001B16D959|nr:class I SAM-dependent methyltransferase [Paenibacillus lactis]GIO90130.1 methyltransferase [Paenibacillus lactis]